MNGAPLLTKDAFSCSDFGVPTHDPAVRALASQLNAVLVSLGTEVPPSLASVFAERLAAYPGPGRRFIELFYVASTISAICALFSQGLFVRFTHQLYLFS